MTLGSFELISPQRVGNHSVLGGRIKRGRELGKFEAEPPFPPLEGTAWRPGGVRRAQKAHLHVWPGSRAALGFGTVRPVAEARRGSDASPRVRLAGINASKHPPAPPPLLLPRRGASVEACVPVFLVRGLENRRVLCAKNPGRGCWGETKQWKGRLQLSWFPH